MCASLRVSRNPMAKLKRRCVGACAVSLTPCQSGCRASTELIPLPFAGTGANSGLTLLFGRLLRVCSRV